MQAGLINVELASCFLQPPKQKTKTYVRKTTRGARWITHQSNLESLEKANQAAIEKEKEKEKKRLLKKKRRGKSSRRKIRKQIQMYRIDKIKKEIGN